MSINGELHEGILQPTSSEMAREAKVKSMLQATA